MRLRGSSLFAITACAAVACLVPFVGHAGPADSASPPAGPGAAGSGAATSAKDSVQPAPFSASVSGSTADKPEFGPEAQLMRYEESFAKRKLGNHETLLREDLEARMAEAEELTQDGRIDEAVARLSAIVAHPKFNLFQSDDIGLSTLTLLGEAFVRAGATAAARTELRRVIADPAAWKAPSVTGKRATRKLVDIALEQASLQSGESLRLGLSDTHAVPADAPEDVRGEVAYLQGRQLEAAGKVEEALVAYTHVTTRSRHWSQATYLQGMIEVERGRMKEGESLFCKVADPLHQDKKASLFADERFFAVRDLARLALGRVAHEQSRNDDARYYYYLVPRDSNRIAEALYESATTRYEKKDYAGARELLDELSGLGQSHRYEDEARILDAYVDLALCRFPDADRKLRTFIEAYEPVRAEARALVASDAGLARLTEETHGGSAPGEAKAGESKKVDGATGRLAVASLLRVDPAYGMLARKLAVLERQTSGLELIKRDINDIDTALATGAGLKPAQDTSNESLLEAEGKREELRDALAATERAIEELPTSDSQQAATFASDLRALYTKDSSLRTSVAGLSGSTPGTEATAHDADVTDLIKSDKATREALQKDLLVAKREIETALSALAKDALTRFDYRLSRLLRRARLGRIESVLGKKRGLEVEIEAIQNGFLPQDAVDSLDPARYLRDHEEYWPFEGDDWADEFVGGEDLR